MLTKDQVKQLIATEIADGLNFIDSEIASRRQTIADYIQLDMSRDLPAQRGRSSVVDGMVGNQIGMIIPSLMRIVAGGPIIGEYIAAGVDDEKAARAATDYVNDVVFRQDNEGERIIYEWGYDGLTQIVGMVKAYWQEEFEYKQEQFDNVSPDQLALMALKVQSTPSLEIVAHQQTDSPIEAEGPDGPIQATQSSHSIVVREKINKSYCKIEAIPPDEFVISRGARSLEDAIVKSHRRRIKVGDLIAMGYPKEQVEALPDAQGTRITDRWNSGLWQSSSSGAADPMLREVAIHEGIVRCSADEQGLKDYYFVAGGSGSGSGSTIDLLEFEPYKCQIIFADFCPQPLPHTFFGRCPGDETVPIQKVKTATLRQIQDNMYLSNSPQRIVNKNMIDSAGVNALGNVVPGGIVLAGDVNAVRTEQIPFFAAQSLPMLAYWDDEAEKRTGVSRASMGLDPDSLAKQSATSANIQFNASQGRIELIARIWATGGLRKLFRGVLNILREYQDFPRAMKRNGQIVQMDPQQWAQFQNWDVSINTGLGTGSREKDMSMLQLIGAAQREIYQAGGPGNGVVTAGQIANTVRRLCEATGIKNTAQFINEVPTNFDPKPAPPQPSPDVVVYAQVEQMKATKKQETDLAKIASDERVSIYNKNVDAAIKSEQLNVDYSKLGLDAIKLESDASVKMADILKDLRLAKQQNEKAVVN